MERDMEKKSYEWCDSVAYGLKGTKSYDTVIIGNVLIHF